MLKGRSGRQTRGRLHLADQLPAVERVQKIDIAGAAAEYLDGQLAAVLHKNAGRLLIGIAAVLELDFIGHGRTLLYLFLLTMRVVQE